MPALVKLLQIVGVYSACSDVYNVLRSQHRKQRKKKNQRQNRDYYQANREHVLARQTSRRGNGCRTAWKSVRYKSTLKDGQGEICDFNIGAGILVLTNKEISQGLPLWKSLGNQMTIISVIPQLKVSRLFLYFGSSMQRKARSQREKFLYDYEKKLE